MSEVIEIGGIGAEVEAPGLTTLRIDGLNRADLRRHRAYVGGVWCDAGNNRRLVVENPADGSPLGTVPDMSAAEAQRAIDAAGWAFPAWGAPRPPRSGMPSCAAGPS
jgi:Aldehyde dehydrogenase family